ncbi:Ig-like domain repeat protein [Granulicella cerasi]|uniref:Ig-like domain repeat protein n=1 Tax=Granulicella cerasi TaxID=741063 RepID=UPI0021E0F912|nr:Ig-like domain repeat protein [Granulicella cerasi]
MANFSQAKSLLSIALLACGFATHAQTQPSAVPVPFTSAAAGFGTSTTTAVCTGAIASTDGSALGDGCPATQAKLNAAQGAAVDKYGNIYFADYGNKQVRVVYNGGTQLAAAIKAANSGYVTPLASAPSPTPVAGNVYTLAGVGVGTSTAYPTFTVLNVSGLPCANYAASGQPTALDTLGDGCPGASAPVAARDVKVDADGNLFLADYSNGRIRVFCVNCAVTTSAAKLITTENPTVTAPANGAMYTIAGFANGYRDAQPGYTTAANSSTTAAQAIALLRSPTGVAISSSDDVFIADNLNNAVRVLYNGGSAAKAILVAQGTASPVVGYVYTIAGAGCVSAATNKTGSVSSANACLTTAGSDTAALGNAVGTGPVWSVYLDANSNVFYTDATNQRIKVIYGGVANPTAVSGTLQAGYTYSFAGQGTGLAGAQNGVAPSALVLSSAQSIGGDTAGNVFFFDYGTSYLYEVYAETGIAAILGGNGAIATAAANATCSGGTTGPVMTDAYYDGCPATQAKLSSPRGPVVADASGNLYFGDAISYVVRKFAYNTTFPATGVGSTSAAQPYAFTFLGVNTLLASSFPVSDFAEATGSTCSSTLAVVAGSTCVENVSFKPTAAALRQGAVRVNASAGTLGSLVISGVGTGAALAVDPGTQTTIGSGYSVNAVATDAAGAVYFTDATTKSALRAVGSTVTTLATGFNNPQGIAADGAGNVFIADAGANTITEIPAVGTKFTLSATVSSPRQLAIAADGTLLVADSGNNRIASFAPGSNVARTVGFTGLSTPTGVAVGADGTIYATSGSAVQQLTTAGVQSTRATLTATAIAVDAANNLYSTANTTATETTAASQSFTLYTGTTVRGIALDSTGNVYLADSGATGVVKSARTSGYYKFNTSPATTTLELTSIGSAPVSTTSYTVTNTSDFTVSPATTNGCSGALASGNSCALSAAFSQVSTGVPTDTVSFTATVTNGSPYFTLTAATATPAIVVTAAPTSVVYGNSVTLKALVYGPNNTGGTVTFYAGGVKLTTATSDANASASYTYTPAVGSYSITADYTPSGSTTATVVTTTAATFTVTQATPTTSLSVTPTTGFATSTYTATVTVSSTAGTPSGTVTFLLGSTQLATGTLDSTGKATGTFTNLPAGTNCITAKYAGSTNFASVTSACANVTVVTQVTPTIALTVSPTTGYPTTSYTAVATLTASVGTPTGSVVFYSGTTSLGPAVAVNSSGIATSTFTGLASGTNCITAVFTSATTNYASVTSTCSNVTVAAGFSVTPASTALAFPSANYQQAQTQLNIVTGGRMDTLTFACNGLPSKLQCSFSPASVKLAGDSSTVQVQMLVANSGAKYASVDRRPLTSSRRALELASLPALALLIFGLRRRRAALPMLAMLLLGIVGAGALTGCSGQDPTTLQQGSGTYNFSVNVYSGTTTLQTINFTLTIP